MRLNGQRMALLVADQFEDVEALYPYYRLQEDGAAVTVVGVGGAERALSKHGYPLAIDRQANAVRADDFEGIVIPGGYSPDKVRLHRPALDLVRDLDRQGKVVAAICHAGWVLASAGICRGRRMTSWPSIRDDLVNAGAQWLDEPVVVDHNLITSRKPDDLPAFCREIVASMAVGVHQEIEI